MPFLNLPPAFERLVVFPAASSGLGYYGLSVSIIYAPY